MSAAEETTPMFTIKVFVMTVDETDEGDSLKTAVEFPEGTPPSVIAYLLTRVAVNTDHDGFIRALRDLQAEDEAVEETT